jgi:hypothetical protein
MKEFLNEVCKIDSKSVVDYNTLYSAYILWCIKRKEKPAMAKESGDYLRSQGFEKKKTRFQQYWVGLDIIEEYKEELKKLEHYQEVEN